MATRGRRTFARRGSLPSRQWSEIATNWALNLTATGSATVWGLQSPAASAGLTALPPEDVVLMRIRGSFLCSLSAGGAVWTVGLTVQDQTWTPAATFALDADKRWLWLRTFQAASTLTGPVQWLPPGYLLDASDPPVFAADAAWTELDIAPKVKLEAGQGLYLVGYEGAGAATLVMTSADMRMLWQTKRR